MDRIIGRLRKQRMPEAMIQEKIKAFGFEVKKEEKHLSFEVKKKSETPEQPPEVVVLEETGVDPVPSFSAKIEKKQRKRKKKKESK